MAGYKEPGFADRTAAAAGARAKALALLKAAPVLSPEEQAERVAKAAAREAAKAEQREAAQAERLAKREAELARKREKAESERKVEPTEEERKQARDARYAARKARKR